MPLRVICLCTYRTAGKNWRSRDWYALKFIKAIKQKPVKGFAYVPVGETNHYLTQSTANQAPTWFGQIAASRIKWGQVARIAVVPIPDSKCTKECNRPPKTFGLAEQLASSVPVDAVVADVLRWIEEMPSAHQDGGTRDPQRLYRKITATGKLPATDRKLVLVDDVLTSGGHLRAAAAFLTDRGYTVRAAICAGRADNDEIGVADAFELRVESAEDFTDDPNWSEPEPFDFPF